MVTGLNTEIPYQGEVYHVQTEDGGAAHPVLTTHIFKGGAILFSKRAPYPTQAEEELIRSLMKEQHKALLKALVTGGIPAVGSKTET